MCLTLRLSDWSKEILTESQKQYAVNDVQYLYRLWGKLKKELVNKGLEEVAVEDINRLVNDMNESLRPVIDSKLEEISGLLEKRELWNVMHANDSKIKKYEDRISELESSKEKVTNKSKSNV